MILTFKPSNTDELFVIQANILGWNGTSANSGAGQYGTCCAEMDIWEANSQAAAYTPHVCTTDGQVRFP